MDLHDIARGRGALDHAMARLRCPTLAVGISSDMLYPAYQQRQIADTATAVGAVAEYFEIDSPHGHDAFLINGDQLAGPLERFLADREQVRPVATCRRGSRPRSGAPRSR